MSLCPERFLSVFLFFECIELIRAGRYSPVQSLHRGVTREHWKIIVLVHPVICNRGQSQCVRATIWVGTHRNRVDTNTFWIIRLFAQLRIYSRDKQWFWRVKPRSGKVWFKQPLPISLYLQYYYRQQEKSWFWVYTSDRGALTIRIIFVATVCAGRFEDDKHLSWVWTCTSAHYSKRIF